MSKVVIFSCTNRQDSNTLKVSKVYQSILNAMGVNNELFDFRELPENINVAESFGKRTAAYGELLNEIVVKPSKFIFISPEYNGSYPGILKTFIDSAHPREWANKKACLVGVADGRAGNLRGMEHLTGVLHYLKMHVYYNKLPISQVAKVFNQDFSFNEEQMKACNLQVKGFLEF